MRHAYAPTEVAGQRAIALHWSEFIAAIAAVDAAVVLVVMLGVVRVWEWARLDFTPTDQFELWFVGTWILWLIALRSSGAYDLMGASPARGHAASLLRALAIVVAVTLMTYFFAPRSFPRSTSLLTLVPVFLGLVAWRGIAAARLPHWRALQRRVLLLGVGESTERLAMRLASAIRRVPYTCVAFLTDKADAPESIGGVPVLSGTASLWEHVREHGIQEICVAREERPSEQTRASLIECFHAGVTVGDAAQLYEDLTGRVPVPQIADTWYAELASLPRRPYHALKRALDVIVAAGLLIALAPVMACIAVAVLIDDGRPVLYSQTRLGRRGVPFTIRKFRSMHRFAERDGERYAERSDPRATRLGRFLRPSGLDELPQLWDVLLGRMSLIGPRAERPGFTAELAASLSLYRARLLVRPGIVGWAEVNVPHAATLKEHLERLEYDLFYIKRADVLLDVDVALRALGLALTGRR